MFLGIEVMSYKRYGQRLTVTEAVPRDTILKFLSALFLGIGYLIALLRSDHRAMHDLTVGSVVIKRAPAEEETPSS
jgi:uncharacterized RDD family membrane protein YckC